MMLEESTPRKSAVNVVHCERVKFATHSLSCIRNKI
jgi:hypothetical protein